MKEEETEVPEWVRVLKELVGNTKKTAFSNPKSKELL